MKQLILFPLFLLFSFTLAAQGYAVGDVAEDFSLLGTDDKKHALADYPEAKGYIVIFTCNHCPYSVAYEDRIIALQTKYAEQGYPVIAINPNDPELYPADNFTNMQKRAEEKGFNFPYLMDEGQAVFPKYGAIKTPHVYLLDADRVVRYIGAIDDATEESQVEEKYVENAVAALIKGEAPSPSVTKAIGCGIKVKR